MAPSSGEINIEGEVRDQGIAFVQQTPSLLPWRTAFQNAALGFEIQGKMKGVSREEGAIHSLQNNFGKFGLSGFENAFAATLSGGMRQKVALVAGLSIGPGLLFCDEPFSAIDYVARLGLLNLFKDNCKINSVTTVLVTHNIEEAIFLADHVVVLSRRPGRILDIIETKAGGIELPDNHSFVKSRQSREFRELHEKIWECLTHG